jgi:hypothetical protein
LAFFVTSLESLHKKQNEHKIKWKHNNEKSHHDDLLDALLKLQESDQLDTHLKTNQIKVVSMARSLGTNQQNTNTHTHTHNAYLLTFGKLRWPVLFSMH